MSPNLAQCVIYSESDWSSPATGVKAGLGIVENKVQKRWPQLCRVLRRSIFTTNFVEFSWICVVIKCLILLWMTWTCNDSGRMTITNLFSNPFSVHGWWTCGMKKFVSCPGWSPDRNKRGNREIAAVQLVMAYSWSWHDEVRSQDFPILTPIQSLEN